MIIILIYFIKTIDFAEKISNSNTLSDFDPSMMSNVCVLMIDCPMFNFCLSYLFIIPINLYLQVLELKFRF